MYMEVPQGQKSKFINRKSSRCRYLTNLLQIKGSWKLNFTEILETYAISQIMSINI